MTHDYVDEDVQILVEFTAPETTYRGGTTGKVGRTDDMIKKSQEALDKAMGAINQMAKRVVSVKDSLTVHEQPTTIEVEFALKLDSEAGVYLAKAGAEASFNVKLTWEKEAAGDE